MAATEKLESEYQLGDLLSGQDPLVTLYDYLTAPSGEALNLTDEGKEMVWRANMARYLCESGESYEQWYERHRRFLENWRALSPLGFDPPTWMPDASLGTYAELRALGGCPIPAGTSEVGAYRFPQPSPLGPVLVGMGALGVLMAGGYLLWRALTPDEPTQKKKKRR